MTTTFDPSPAARSEDDATSFGALVLGATLLFFFITTTPFADLTALTSVDAATERSNLVNQLVFLGLTAATWIVGFSSPTRSEIARPRLLLGLMLFWFVAVSLISPYPTRALKQVVLAALTIGNAGMFLLLPRTDRQFARLLAFAALATLALAYWGVAFMPRYAIHQADEIREPMNVGLWRGHFVHKNVAAAVMALLAFVGLFVRRMGLRVQGGLIVVGALVFLAHTGGKSATASLPAVLVIAWMFERWPITRIPIAVGGVAMFNFVALGAAGSPAIRELVEGLGVDPTFTNRSDVWSVGVAALADRPLTGYGFQMFWQTDAMLARAGRGEDWAYAAFNGHNGYLDAMLTTGAPGLLLTLIWVLFLPLRDVSRAEGNGNNPALTTFFVRVWLYGLFQACIESVFFQSGSPLWFFMMVAIFGLRLQANAAVVGGAPATAKRYVPT